MPLIQLTEWRLRHFIEPRPALSDLRRACRQGTLPAQKICKHWYIQITSDTDLTPVAQESQSYRQVDDLVAKVMAG